MSELDKEAVLNEFTEAYKKVHGKKPNIEASNGWYSVDDGKNMRLAQLNDWTAELKSEDAKAKPKKAAPAKSEKATKTAKKTPAKQSTAKKPTKKSKPAKQSTAKKPPQRKSGQTAGESPAQAWLTYLEKQTGSYRLPRGFKA